MSVPDMMASLETRDYKGRQVLVLKLPKKIKAIELRSHVVEMLKRISGDKDAAFADHSSTPYSGIIMSDVHNLKGELFAMVTFETPIDTVWLTRPMIALALEFHLGVEQMKQARAYRSN